MPEELQKNSHYLPAARLSAHKVVVPIEYLVATREPVPGDLSDAFAGQPSPKHLRKMVEGVCVIKTTIHENLPTTFQYFQFVTWKFLSLSATALIELSLTGVVPWAAPQ